MSTYLKNMAGYKHTQLKNKSFEEIQMLLEKELKRVNIFVDMDAEYAKEELDQESSKRQKTSESSKLAEEPRDKEPDELSQEELQQMMIIVPEQGMNVEALQTKLYDSYGVHHVSIVKGINIYMLIEKEYPLSRGTLTLMLVAKLLVDQDNEMSRELLRKIFMQAERPRR
ncbi:hypothetical protein Tco_0495766 [Tanacetum coccineum]